MQPFHMHPHNDYSLGYLLVVAASKQPNNVVALVQIVFHSFHTVTETPRIRHIMYAINYQVIRT